MIYACTDCGFLFFRVGEVKSCPYCDGAHFRPATGEESEKFRSMVDAAPAAHRQWRP